MQLTGLDFLLFIVIVIGAITGYKLQYLSRSGWFATIVVGFGTLLGFGLRGLLVMGAFFVTSSFWSKYKSDRKKQAEEKNDKNGARDAFQVFANGGIPAITSLLYLFLQDEILLFMFIGALATANSDTWASEIGSLSRKQPRQILTFRKVDSGTSGAVSLLGTAAAFLGAGLIAFISVFLWTEISPLIGFVIGFSGFLGNIIDTLLGATVQITYTCSNCGLVTEKRLHCQQRTIPKSGYPLFNNDTVNFISIAVGSLITLLFLM